ncbi:TolB family protein [Sphaerisporangium fuscum]|uniref:TolB family protein n=1 Tax=Sphaerisporangium fuscum TaxID=2835868 RepID=UPI001BDD51EA|nr:PD40 domain-containing protein [Sphaerisporangium fuscum]
MKQRVLAGAALAAALTASYAVSTGVPASAASTPERVTAARQPLTGEAVYFDFSHNRFTVDHYVPGKGFARLAQPSDNFQFSASPDGKKVAWITAAGKVLVKDGAKVTTVSKGAQGGAPCLTPTWSPDSKRVAFGVAGDDVMVVNADGTGAHKAGRTAGVCHLAWSGDGRYLAGYTGEADAIYKLDLTTGKAAKVRGVKDYVVHVQSLSPDGRKVIAETMPRSSTELGDGGWPSWFTPAVIDTATGRKTPIPVTGKLIGAFYQADGRLVVRVAGSGHNTLVVLDEAGKELQRLDEPARAKKQALLRVVA